MLRAHALTGDSARGWGRQSKRVRGENGVGTAVHRAGLYCQSRISRTLSSEPRPLSALAGTVILELSKEKTNERLLDRQAAAFTASVQHVEAELSAQIRYLTQVSMSGMCCAPTLSPP